MPEETNAKDLVVINGKEEVYKEVKTKLVKLTKSPLHELSETDSGDEVQKRFRYQHTYTALIAILMYNGKLPYDEILCEHHEDIFCVLNNGKYEGIQIKTRQLSDGPFKRNDKAVDKSIRRFIELDKKYPNTFERFIFVTNVDFFVEEENGNSLITLLDKVNDKSRKDDVTGHSTIDKYINQLSTDLEVSVSTVIRVLKMIDLQRSPGMDEIESKIITDHLSKIPKCSELKVEKLSYILNQIITKVYFASSKKVEDAIKDYAALRNARADLSIQDAEINTKRINRKMIDRIIEEFSKKPFYLLSSPINPLNLSPNREYKMRKKMNYGYIDPDQIMIMEHLRDSAENYFLEKYHRDNNLVEAQAEFAQIMSIVLNQAVEAKIVSKKVGAQYGEQMLMDIEKRLENIVSKRSLDINNCPYEILKGMVGMLTGECKIAFSNQPEGGWKFDESDVN